MGFLDRFGSRFWKKGPRRVDWILDLESSSFGPLRLGTVLDDVKKLLGRPSDATWNRTPYYLAYHHLGLELSFDKERKLDDLTIDPNLANPTVRLSAFTSAPARSVTEPMIIEALGKPSSSDREGSLMIEWLQRGHCSYLDLSEEGEIVGIGFMSPMLASVPH